MYEASRSRWLKGIGAAVIVAALGATATVVAPGPAEARVFVGVGFGFPGYYYPAPYYYGYYGYPAPYYPPPAYYAPPAPAYYPAPGAAPAAPRPQITYTNRPPFYNHAGQQCREYETPQRAYGTACRGTDGQWRVTNID